MSAPIEVCAAVVRDGDRILVARRTRPADLAGCWEFPGGKQEPGETAAECLRRELLEELSLPIRAGEFLGATLREGQDGRPALRLGAYAARLDGAADQLRLVDGTHDRAAWVTADELRELRLAPLDVPLIDAAIASLETPC